MAQRVVVGVSGGVDSAATLLELVRQGWQVMPVYLELKCGLDERDRQRLSRLEQVTGLTVTVIDGKELFARVVKDPFIADLAGGLTPNPCVICNQCAKLKLLFDQADRLGAEKVATGHYARIVPTEQGPRLAAAESSKDQSYMLYRIERSWVPRLEFLLGGLEKDQVRQRVREELGADQGDGDSQDICFLDGRTLDSYIDDRLPPKPGPMVTPEGLRLGTHRGLAHYTLGQRKGLGLAGGPWFVVAKDQRSNRLVLDRCPAATSVLTLEKPRLLAPLPGRCQVKTRYRSAPVDCNVFERDGTLIVELDRPQAGVAPGQSAVLYDGPLVVGGGFIAPGKDN